MVIGPQAGRNRSGQRDPHPHRSRHAHQLCHFPSLQYRLALAVQAWAAGQAGACRSRLLSEKPQNRTCWSWWLVWVCWEWITLGTMSPFLPGPQFPPL